MKKDNMTCIGGDKMTQKEMNASLTPLLTPLVDFEWALNQEEHIIVPMWLDIICKNGMACPIALCGWSC